MLKMFTEPASTGPARYALNGPTMGARWSALFHAAPGYDCTGLQGALQAEVDRIEAQMSVWQPQSDLMRLNRAEVGVWHDLKPDLARVLDLALRIGRASGGAFDIGMGHAVRAWGFGPDPADPKAIAEAMATRLPAAHEALELDGLRLRKTAPLTLDLNGIAKGYGVDRLAATMTQHGIDAFLVGIDGELCAHGLQPDGSAWTIAVEAPDHERRAPHAILQLHDGSVATSGDYRHWVEVRGKRLSHTMDPRRGAPLANSPASVTVVARSCAEADAWATALMVAGADAGAALAARQGLDALFLVRDDLGGVQGRSVGRLFSQGSQRPLPDASGGSAAPQPDRKDPQA